MQYNIRNEFNNHQEILNIAALMCSFMILEATPGGETDRQTDKEIKDHCHQIQLTALNSMMPHSHN